jgi:hypothetical protein
VRRAPTSYKTTPEPPTGHNTVAAVPQGIASRFERYLLAGGREKPAMAQEANIVPFELRKTMAQMLGDVIALLAMKHRRAPVPVSSALLRTLWMRGFPGNLAELESFARRLLFLGDERMLLAEFRRGRAPIASRQENSQGPSGIALGQRTETEPEQECQCLPTN